MLISGNFSKYDIASFILKSRIYLCMVVHFHNHNFLNATRIVIILTLKPLCSIFNPKCQIYQKMHRWRWPII